VASQEHVDALNLDRYLAAIDAKIRATGSADWSRLSPAERMTITAYFFAMEVSNGGIEQFFINPAGDRWRDTLFALKVLGPDRLTVMYEEALSVFPGGAPSEDHLTRCRQYQAAGDTARDLLQRMTDQYYDLQGRSAEHCLYASLGRFATKHLATTKLT
jgi:hypothetical protein